ncbi:MAG TPA: hypothetical protein VME70_01970 [Mycobacteriales bacterium]|nr:hypothetical protein [Mycobacteriales bacterium]
MSRRGGAARAVLAGLVSAAAAQTAWGRLRPSGRSSDESRWTRRNFRGRPVTLLLGPAVGAGALGGAVLAAKPARRAALIAVAGAALTGGYDDLYGNRHALGLRGHARALRDGELTTGVVKLVAITGAGALAAGQRSRKPVDIVLGTVLTAGGANLVNLFDLRPGRALKVSTLAAAGLLRTGGESRVLAGAAAGAALAAIPVDLGERAMLGDCGAGALGALLGTAAACSGGRARQVLLAAVVVGLTLASERVSFSAVIDGHPVLHALDQVGRQHE